VCLYHDFTTRYPMYLQRNSQALSRNHCLQWKSNNYYIFWVCVYRLGYLTYKAHVLYYTVICGLSGLLHLSGLSHKTPLIFWFSVQLLSETFIILGRILWDTVINVRRYSCKVPIILFRFAKNTQISNVMKIRLMGNKLFRWDGQTDRQR